MRDSTLITGPLGLLAALSAWCGAPKAALEVLDRAAVLAHRRGAR
jgi:hypothetical protein